MRNCVLAALSTCLAAASLPAQAAQLADVLVRGGGQSIPVAFPQARLDSGGDTLATIAVNTPDLIQPEAPVGRVDADAPPPAQPDVLGRREPLALPAPASRDAAQPAAPPAAAAGYLRPSPAPAPGSDLAATDSPAENGGEQVGGAGAPVLSELDGLAAGKIQPAEVYDRYGRRTATVENDAPLFYSFLHGRGAGDAPTTPVRPEQSETRPRPAPTPAPAANPAELVDALQRRAQLDEAQRAALAWLVAKAAEAKDMELLANLTFLSLHDSPSKAVVRSALIAMAFNEHAKWILAQEARFAIEPIGEGRRGDMAAKARAAAVRYQGPHPAASASSYALVVAPSPMPNVSAWP